VSYAIYTVTLKKVVKTESRINMMLFFGLIGVINAVAILPLLFLAHATGIEPFHFPSSEQMWLLTLNGLIGTVLSDYLWARSVLLLSPLISTLGLSLTIPTSMLAQSFFLGDDFSFGYLLGATLTFGGFILVNVDSEEAHRELRDVVPASIHKLIDLPSPGGLRDSGLSDEDLDLAMQDALDGFGDDDDDDDQGENAPLRGDYHEAWTKPGSRRGSVTTDGLVVTITEPVLQADMDIPPGGDEDQGGGNWGASLRLAPPADAVQPL